LDIFPVILFIWNAVELNDMIVLVLFIQIVSLVFYFRIIIEGSDYNTGTESSFESKFWYCIAGLNFLFILRFIYIQLNFSYKWYEQIMEFISLGICIFVVFPTLVYYLIRRKKKQKKG